MTPMNHAIFKTRPWLTDSPPLHHPPVGMLGRRESMLFYHLAKDVYTGQGTIIDAGSFLGKSAWFLAQGLRANPGFDSERDRIHCFDNFLVNDELTIDFIARGLHQTMHIGESTRAIFERQVAPVRDLLEVHEGDFHVAPWKRQPIEILMVDIAKTEALGKRVVAGFFPDLVPGCSIVIHQDYHHPWLPHIHVVMEYLADYFEIVAPRVDDSAVFFLAKAIPARVLQRAIDYDFSLDEQLALMDRALARLPAEDRHVVELARLMLRGKLSDGHALRVELDDIEHRNAEHRDEPSWQTYLGQMRNYVDETDGWQQRDRGDFPRTLELVAGLISRGRRTSPILVMWATALVGLNRHAEAEPILREALQKRPRNGYAYIVMARVLADLGRLDEAEAELVRGILDRAAQGARPVDFLERLGGIWEKLLNVERATAVLDQLRRELAEEPEVWVLDARVHIFLGRRREAVLSLRKAVAVGLPPARCAKVRQQTGLAPEEWSSVAHS